MPVRFQSLEAGHFSFESADCRLRCLHCSHGIKKRLREAHAIHRIIGRISGKLAVIRRRYGQTLAEFEELVASLPVSHEEPVCLSGYDVLEEGSVLTLMEICKRHQRKVRIISPGLRLADRAFAGRLAAYRPEITLTYLSRRPGTFAHMTGHPGAKELIEQAIDNLRELDVGISVNFVATSDNCDELSDVAAYLYETVGIQEFTVLNFFPDWVHYVLDSRTRERFARFGELNRQLVRLARGYRGSDKRICLWGVPPCKLSGSVLTGGYVTFSVRENWDPACRIYRHHNCGSCRFSDRCFFVSRYYRDAYPDEEFAHQKVNQAYPNLVY
jgi:MoaA/NifB/PqqE/SkfB family radical SAM enzyme